MASSIVLSLIFAALAASTTWQSGKRAWGYIKMGREFMQAASTQETGRSLLFAGSLWGLGAFVFLVLAVILVGLAIYYGTLL
jgi:hypothetical protein